MINRKHDDSIVTDKLTNHQSYFPEIQEKKWILKSADFGHI